MTQFYGFTTLNDAWAFLLEARGLPDIKSVHVRKQRCVRACILLSWIALEECLDVGIEDWQKSRQGFGPFSVPLKQRLSAVLAALKRPAIDDAQYNSLRAIRNVLTHPKATQGEPALTVAQAESTFGFCMSTIRLFLPAQVDLQF
jgi:hypothetical protein